MEVEHSRCGQPLVLIKSGFYIGRVKRYNILVPLSKYLLPMGFREKESVAFVVGA